jgi:hypothetical protein
LPENELDNNFPPPSVDGHIENYAKEFGALEDGISDVLTG